MTPKKAAVRPAGWGRRRRAGFYWRTSYDLRIESAGFGNDPTIPVASFFSRGLYHQPPAFSADGISAVFLGTYGKATVKHLIRHEDSVYISSEPFPFL